MRNKNLEPQLLPNEEVYQNKEGFPAEAQKALDSLDLSLFGDEEIEQQKAREMLQNWAETLWHGMIYLSRHLDSENQTIFRNDYAEKLTEFIAHPDHGISHSYYVNKNAHHLVEIDGEELSEEQETHLQLLSLTHDAMQTLPFSMPEKTTGQLAQKNQKNEHARIISVLARMYGKELGFDPKTTRALSFGLRKHDSTYDKQYYPNGKLGYLSKLLHDADKLFGASIQTDIPSLISGGLKRNLEANDNSKGGYLIRTDLSAEYRNKVRYGDRCYSDSLAMIFRELDLPMYTDAGKEIASQRKDQAFEQMEVVYGEVFDNYIDLIHNKILPRIQNGSANLEIYSIGMDQNQELESVSTAEELEKLISDLYEKVLVLPKKHQRKGYSQEDARGWKLKVIIDGQTHYIDPSIARFCFDNDGKEIFLAELKKAFEQRIPEEKLDG